MKYKKRKLLIDDTAVYADWLNNTNLRNKLASQLTVLIYKEGYPPEWDEEVFEKVLDQVENYKTNRRVNKTDDSDDASKPNVISFNNKDGQSYLALAAEE